MSTELERLKQIKHIVVLMMENRSFDHMLGYLTGAGMPEVNGLTGSEQNLEADGTPHPVFEFAADQTAFVEPGKTIFDNSLDPCHSPDCVRAQLADSNGGFVKNFVAEKNPPASQRGLVMGHYTAAHLPVYDHLAREYCVCDAWHSSIPGDTWPNRLFSLSGRTSPRVHFSLIDRLKALLGGSGPANLPIYDVESFTRHLDLSQWRWYSHDPATLRGADKLYRQISDLHRDNFAYFDRQKESPLTRVLESAIVEGDSFLDHAAQNALRQVSWIDPNFIDLHVLDPNSNDDHPPSDVRAGQALVLMLHDALRDTQDWRDTLLVVTYDEHGGFYDHVAPPAVNDGSGFPTLGVRVPALAIGPRVKNQVSHQLFDHTSLIKTILLRFAADPEAAIAKMGPRVATAQHLGVLLEDGPRTDLTDHGLQDWLAGWRAQSRAERAGQPSSTPSKAPDGAGQPLILNDFQEEFARFARRLHGAGLNP
jgi:phospholipase C